MKWYIPSWNGDVRIEPHPDNEKASRIVIEQPTAAERAQLELLAVVFRQKKWIPESEQLWPAEGYRESRRMVTVAAPLAKVAPAVAKALKAGRQVLTAVLLKDGRVETVEGVPVLGAALEETKPGLLDKLAEKAADIGKAAATVTRATPCCPQCYLDAIKPATEVLLEFLSPEQHADWAAHRFIIVEGGRTQHRYLLAHRHSAQARRMGRMCMDLDDDVIVHFHDNSVPPEEEVLGAKLVLEHREAWLRNEATLFNADSRRVQRFKNPFGDLSDGTEDAGFTANFGALMAGFAGMQP